MSRSSSKSVDVVVVEGRGRVGGRLHTTEVAGVPVDAGATWVAPGHSGVRDLASRLACDIVPQFHTGKGVISLDGNRKVESLTAMTPWVTLDLARALGRTDQGPVTAQRHALYQKS